MSKRKKSTGKLIKPQIWVFCEGETERAYVNFLRSKYRIPIEVVCHIAGTSITEAAISKYKQSKPAHPKDRHFLLYDGDVEAVVERLKKIKHATLLLSNPCIELWFLLHFKNQKSAISSKDCVRELENRTASGYQKGKLHIKLLNKLQEQGKTACERANKLENGHNPSSNLYEFINLLEEIINRP